VFKSFPRNYKWPLWLAAVLLSSVVLAACGSDSSLSSSITATALPQPAPSNTPIPATPLPNYPSNLFGATGVAAELVGGGSTLAEPIYKQWLGEYKKVAPKVNISYQPTGSGSGRGALLGTPVAANAVVARPTVPLDFAGSDAPFNGEDLLKISDSAKPDPANPNINKDVLHVPAALGGVAMAYRLDNYKGELRLSGPTLARIYLGEIKDWSDPNIATDNSAILAGGAFPAKPITVVIRKRANSSGTSEIFTRYLSVVSSDFRTKVGPGGRPNWPTFGQLEGDGNDEVAAAISGKDGTIGYVDLTAAKEKKLPYATIRNQTGRFIEPTTETITAAAQGVSIPDDFRIFVVNAQGEYAYPIVGFTWLIVWRDFGNMPNPTSDKAQALANFLWWGIHDGQKNLPDGFAPLPISLVQRLETRLVNQSGASDAKKVLTFKGQPIFNK